MHTPLNFVWKTYNDMYKLLALVDQAEQVHEGGGGGGEAMLHGTSHDTAEQDCDAQENNQVILRQYDPPPRPKQDLEQLVSAQFDARQLSMAAWSLAKLKPHLPAAAVTSACTALAHHSASSEAMKRGSWRDWSTLLHGLATAGMQCSSSPDQTRLCDQAVQLLPYKLARGAADQDISMTLWAMANISNILYAMGLVLWNDKE
ncbi:hypothetical protein HaLaN_19035, partial [Haematococcus lacustris]